MKNLEENPKLPAIEINKQIMPNGHFVTIKYYI